jgi:5-methylcytosine-specific restriction protein A
MPSINNKICNQCKKIVKLPHDCPNKRNKVNDKVYSKTKRSNDKFYNSQQWRKKRLNILSRDCGLCVMCREEGITTIGRIVDHIVPLNDDKSLALTDSNLQTLCDTHHNQKTAKENKEREENVQSKQHI